MGHPVGGKPHDTIGKWTYSGGRTDDTLNENSGGHTFQVSRYLVFLHLEVLSINIKWHVYLSVTLKRREQSPPQVLRFEEP